MTIAYVCAVRVRDPLQLPLAHAALNAEGMVFGEVLLVPCLRSWLPRANLYVVDTHPTCLECMVLWKPSRWSP